MNKNRSNRGLIATTLLFAAASGLFGFGQGVRVGKQEPKDTGVSVLPDPAAQRAEMIRTFSQMQLQLDSMDKTLKGIERINSAMLRLQFDASKKPANPHVPGPPPSGGEQNGPR
jgi:hypothetical protein